MKETDWEKLYQEWLNSPYIDLETKKELESLAQFPALIKERFSEELEFGTGGLRGLTGAGTNRMNKYIVRRASQGLANFILSRFPEKTDKKVAITYDSRHFSLEFAREAALVFAANGIKALLFEEMRPTPQLSFAIRELDCLAGIVITASHNPSAYNGYKVYGADGGQVVPYLADQITSAIRKVNFFNGVKTMTRQEAEDNGLLAMISSDFDNTYLEKVKALAFQEGNKHLKIVYSPLHGTGIFLIPRMLKELGYSQVFVVEEQARPDPDFSTVRYPNPEDKEAFALALDLSSKKEADLVLATDPDADRVGCAVKNEAGNYTLLSGNQLGALLLDYILKQLQATGMLPPDGAMVKTIVTSNLGREIANYYGIETVETLTGFKYIGEKIKEFEEKKERQFLFGYEESFGYLCGTFVRDKDAVIASLLTADMLNYYQKEGKNILSVLEDIYLKYGYFVEDLHAVEFEKTSQMKSMLAKFRETQLENISGLRVVEKRDYKQRLKWKLSEKTKEELSLPSSDTLYYVLQDGSWFCIRPSGTEPKVKLYFSVKGNSRKEAEQKLDHLKNDILNFASKR